MDKNTDKATKVEKEKKSIFKQIEEQQEKLKKLQAKKEKTIKKKITDTFLFLADEENFIKFEKVIEDESFKEKIKEFIIIEMDKEIAENEKKKKEVEDEFNHLLEKTNADSIQIKLEHTKIEEQINSIFNEIEILLQNKDNISQSIQALQLQKPSWFRIKANKEYKERMCFYSDQLLELLEKEKELNYEYINLQEDKIHTEEVLKENEEKICSKKINNERIIQSQINEIKKI